ncbi:DgyrCDS7368 [Dimorphilus gyrociliatus]|uniref:Small integral membrane protein 15 n=1 Tax=Dimorphilus gyrociliatus TaxID=2664684 RepID=A0A7I8VQV5_9ANNE|nr:DgyrCDS7368 [Dimorphilus gyrociliatus]
MSNASEYFDWKYYMRETIIFAGQHPYLFVYYVLLALSPLFGISAYLSYKLAKDIESQEKKKKRKKEREANIAKARGKDKPGSLKDKKKEDKKNM